MKGGCLLTESKSVDLVDMHSSIRNETILIIDDDREITNLLEVVLKAEGFKKIIKANSAKEGITLFKKFNPDLIILDVMLPDGSGHNLIKNFKELNNIPVLFISAKTEEMDRLLGFALGADDYITKPFSPKEVAYRVKARLKNRQLITEKKKENLNHGKICYGDICLLPSAAEVWKKDKQLEFTAKEFQLLHYLMKNPNRVLSKEMICQQVWGDDFFGYDNTISVHIRKIRLKIEEKPSNPRLIKTVIGLGYKFVPGDSK